MCVLLLGTVYALPRPLGFAQKRTLAEDCRFLFLTSDAQPRGPVGSSSSCLDPWWSAGGALGSGPSHSCWASRWQSNKTQESSYPWGRCWPIRKWQVNPCLPNWIVQRCVGFVKPEWRSALLREQLAVSPPVPAVSSGINACIFLPPFLSLFPFFLSLFLSPPSCSPGIASKL